MNFSRIIVTFFLKLKKNSDFILKTLLSCFFNLRLYFYIFTLQLQNFQNIAS